MLVTAFPGILFPHPAHNPTRLLARAAAAGCCQKEQDKTTNMATVSSCCPCVGQLGQGEEGGGEVVVYILAGHGLSWPDDKKNKLTKLKDFELCAETHTTDLCRSSQKKINLVIFVAIRSRPRSQLLWLLAAKSTDCNSFPNFSQY